MRNLFIIAVLAFGMNVTAQTLPQVASNTKNITSSVLWPGTTYSMNNTNVDGRLTVGNVRTNSIYMDTANGSSIQLGGANAFIGSSLEVATNQATKLGGSLSVRNGSTLNGINNNNAGITNAGLISQVTDGLVNASSKQAVNGSQLHSTNETVETNRVNAENATAQVQTNLDAYISTNDALVTSHVNRLDDRIDENLEAIETLQSTKADKTQVTKDIAKAKTESISYTDDKIKSVNDKIDLNAKTAKLYTDSSIQASETKLNKRIDDLELKIDNRFESVLSYVGNEFKAVNNHLEGLGASMAALSAAATSSVYDANKPTNLNIATGVYGKSTAIAIGMSHFFNSGTKVSVNWSQGSSTKSAVGLGVGVAF